MPSVYWIAIGDLHNSAARLDGIPGLKEARGLIISGDLTFLGGAEAAEKVLKDCTAQIKVVSAQIGNMDKPEVSELLRNYRINTHGQALRLHPDVTVIGVGGSNKTPFNTPSEFSEEKIAALLEQGLAQAGAYKHLVVVSHTPPLRTKCDRLSNGGHAGSQAVREFIERVRPDLCLCGHIHEARSVDVIGQTPVINPGAFADGGYVKLGLDGDGLRAELLQAK